MFSVEFLFDSLKLLIWPFIRISAMFLAAPIFGANTVPVRIRIVLAFTISLMILPVLPAPPEIDPMSAAGILITIQQIVIGLAMGFLMQLVFATVVFMGQTIAMSMGLGFASVIDPQNGVSVPVVSQFFLVLSTLLFISMHGHLVMLSAIAGSFIAIPIGLYAIDPNLHFDLVAWAGHVFLLALLMALPVMVVILLVNLSFGVMTRAAPQLNIFAVGFPATILIGFILMYLTLDLFSQQAQSLFDVGMSTLLDMFAGGLN